MVNDVGVATAMSLSSRRSFPIFLRLQKQISRPEAFFAWLFDATFMGT
jgi:hypothetical protein